MSSNASHSIEGMEWNKADKEMQKKVKAHPMGSRGLGLICAAKNCWTYDPLLLFVHPKLGWEMSLCKGHWRLAQYEMKMMGQKFQTMAAFLMEVARDNGGNLAFASIGKTTGMFGHNQGEKT